MTTPLTHKDAEFEKTVSALFQQALAENRPYNLPSIRKIKDWHDEEITRVMAIGYTFVVEGLKRLGYSTPDDVENFNETALRAAKGMGDLVIPLDLIKKSIEEALNTAFPKRNTDSMICVAPIRVYGLCPHHLLPIENDVSVAYVPHQDDGKCLGLSKLSRVVSWLAARPVLQEQMTADIVDVLYKGDAPHHLGLPQLSSRGAACTVSARHMCMACRGTKHPESFGHTEELRGLFKTDAALRSEYTTLAIKRLP